MYEIYDTRTKEQAATITLTPFDWETTDAAGPAVEQALDDADDLVQMNRTVGGNNPFGSTDGPIGNDGTSAEGYQSPTADFRLERIARAVRPGYLLRELPDGDRRAEAATRYAEGDKVSVDGSRGVVAEVWTDGEHDGPDGDTYQASADSPVYVVGTQDGAEAVPASDLEADDWGSDVSSPDQELADSVAGDAEAGRLEAGPFDFDIPESWQDSDTPNRLILLDAWAGMGGQFDCGGSCCKGTMMSSGMSDGASDRFCAAMKDRVLLWEGWRG